MYRIWLKCIQQSNLNLVGSMDSRSHKFREMDNLQLSDTIVATSSCSQMFAAVTLDDTVTIWKNSFAPFNKQPSHTIAPSATGIVDVQFSNDATELAISSMDASVRIVDLATKEISSIQCPVMSSWKLAFLEERLVTCGDLGSVSFYDRKTKEQVKKLQAGEIFLTCLAKANTEGLIGLGNNNGEVHIFNLENKDKSVNLKPHHKMVRSIGFTEDSNKILTGSDDTTIKVIDVASEKVSMSLEGHKESVSCVRAHPNDSRFLFSCSHDKSIRSWDLRMKSFIDSFQTGSSLWSLEAFPKNVVAGGENGVLSLYSIE